MTLPVKPSVTITSTAPEKTSRPSTLPTKFKLVISRSSGNASLVRSFPFASSSPMLIRPTTGPMVPKHSARISVAHDSKLHQVVSFAFGVCANVQQQRRLGRFRRNQRSQRRTINAGQHADDHLGGGHRRASVSRRNKSVGVTVSHQLAYRFSKNSSSCVAPKSATGSPMPITSAASTNSIPRSPSPRQPQRLQFRFNYLRLADKNYPDAQIACGSQRSVNLSVRRVVATHRVENDFSRQTGFILRLISHRR